MPWIGVFSSPACLNWGSICWASCRKIGGQRSRIAFINGPTHTWQAMPGPKALILSPVAESHLPGRALSNPHRRGRRGGTRQEPPEKTSYAHFAKHERTEPPSPSRKLSLCEHPHSNRLARPRSQADHPSPCLRLQLLQETQSRLDISPKRPLLLADHRCFSGDTIPARDRNCGFPCVLDVWRRANRDMHDGGNSIRRSQRQQLRRRGKFATCTDSHRLRGRDNGGAAGTTPPQLDTGGGWTRQRKLTTPSAACDEGALCPTSRRALPSNLPLRRC